MTGTHKFPSDQLCSLYTYQYSLTWLAPGATQARGTKKKKKTTKEPGTYIINPPIPFRSLSIGIPPVVYTHPLIHREKKNLSQPDLINNRLNKKKIKNKKIGGPNIEGSRLDTMRRLKMVKLRTGQKYTWIENCSTSFPPPCFPLHNTGERTSSSLVS